jgi:hypothetical protein
MQAPFVPRERRWPLGRALWAARKRWQEAKGKHAAAKADPRRERLYFVRFHPRSIERASAANWI